MTEKKTYLVTERAGPWVAGKRRPADGIVVLTDSQAEYELRLGNIVPFPGPGVPLNLPDDERGILPALDAHAVDDPAKRSPVRAKSRA